MKKIERVKTQRVKAILEYKYKNHVAVFSICIEHLSKSTCRDLGLVSAR